MKNNPSILITGSCGFIMGNFVRRLCFQKKRSIISIDKGNKKDISSIYVNKSHEFYLSNINDIDILDIIFNIEKPDIIVHGAIEKNDDSNLTKNLIDVAKAHKTERILYISDSEVYRKESDLCKETFPIKEISTCVKIKSEEMIKSSGLNYNIARLSANYGPRQQSYNFIPGMVKSILAGEEFLIPSSEDTQEYTHVLDTCSAISDIIFSGKDNEIYNVSSNQEFSTMEVAYEVCSILEKYHNIKCYHLIKYGSEKTNNKIKMNCDKLKSIGWQPAIKFKRGIEDTLDWILNNRWIINQ